MRLFLPTLDFKKNFSNKLKHIVFQLKKKRLQKAINKHNRNHTMFQGDLRYLRQNRTSLI